MKDWIDYYVLVMLLLNIFYMGVGVMNHGEPKKGSHNFFIDMLGFLIAIPIFGRALGIF